MEWRLSIASLFYWIPLQLTFNGYFGKSGKWVLWKEWQKDTKMNYDQVKYVLTAIREEFVEHVAKNDLKFPLDDLEGACGICSYLVFQALTQMGLNPVFHMNDCHCYITVEKHYIDLTLRQFAGGAEQVFFHNHPYRIESTSFGFVHRHGKTARCENGMKKLFGEWENYNNPFQQRTPLPETRPLTNLKPVL